MYLAGSFSNTVDFNPDPNLQDNLTAAGGNDAFAMQLTSTGALV